MRPARVGGRMSQTNGFVRGRPGGASILMGGRPLTMSKHEPSDQVGRTDAPPKQYGIGFQIGAATLALLAALGAMGFAYWLRPGPDLNPPTSQHKRTEL